MYIYIYIYLFKFPYIYILNTIHMLTMGKILNDKIECIVSAAYKVNAHNR